MTRTLVVVMVLTGVALAEPPVEKSQNSQLQNSPQTSQPQSSPEEAQRKLRESKARGILLRWLAAQNAGDFAAYRALYATGFRGVRRSGTRVVRLDRNGWLSDRARMFKKPQRVSAAGLTLTDGGAALEATFTQHYRTGNYEDEGQKRIVLVPNQDGFAIGYEELLESRLHPATGAMRFVEDGRVVLMRSPPRDWGTGAIPEAEQQPDEHVMLRASQDVVAGKIPAPLAGEVGKKYFVVDAYRPELPPCAATIASLHVWFRGAISFSVDKLVHKAGDAPVTLAGDGQRLLVGEFAPDSKCPTFGWAFPDAAPPVVAGARAPEGTALEVLDALARNREKLPPGAPADLDFWHRRCRALGLETFRVTEGGAPVELLLASTRCDSDVPDSVFTIKWDQGGSSEYVVEHPLRFWSLWVRRGDQLELRDAGLDAQWLLGRGHWFAADLNGDGKVDFFGGSRPLLDHTLGSPKSSFEDAGLFSSPAGYTLAPARADPPPVVLVEDEPGC